MPVTKETTRLDDLSNRAASGAVVGLWKRVLSQIPTQFGRLVFVAGLRDSSGRYVYRPMVESLGRELADRTLANSHYSVFAEWIACPLSEQKADLIRYFRECGGPHGMDAYRNLVPATAHDVERQLYITDLETLLTMLRFEPAAASWSRTA